MVFSICYKVTSSLFQEKGGSLDLAEMFSVYSEN